MLSNFVHFVVKIPLLSELSLVQIPYRALVRETDVERFSIGN
jgi:hypothetical protein